MRADLEKAKLIEYLDYWQKAKEGMKHDIENLPWVNGKAPEWMTEQVKRIEEFEKMAAETLDLFPDEEM